MKERLRIARHPATVRNALKYTFIVGPILIAINYGDVLLRQQINHAMLAKMALTMLVPYLVSTFSTVNAVCKIRDGHIQPPHKQRR